MRKTETTLALVAKVNKRIMNRMNVEFTDDEMFDLIDAQFVAVAHAINTEQDILLPAFGKFSAPDKRVKGVAKRLIEIGVVPKFKGVYRTLTGNDADVEN